MQGERSSGVGVVSIESRDHLHVTHRENCPDLFLLVNALLPQEIRDVLVHRPIEPEKCEDCLRTVQTPSFGEGHKQHFYLTSW